MSVRCTAALALTLLAGCRDAQLEPEPEPEPEPEFAASTRNHLVWKRGHAVAEDLARALELRVDELCLELGQYDCISEVHLAGLGGHEPYIQGLYVSLREPLVTTPLSLDRVALAACGQRVDADAGAPVVFTELELDGPAPTSDSEAFTATISTLYRRLHGRDPIAAEFELLAELLVDAAGQTRRADAFARQACFAVATTSEFLFF